MSGEVIDLEQELLKRLAEPLPPPAGPVVPDVDAGQAVLVPWTDREHHAERTCVSNTMLGVLAVSPEAYAARFNGPPSERLEQEETTALLLGRLVHMATLEPERFSQFVTTEPAGDGRTKAVKDARVAWQESLTPAHIVVDRRDAALIGKATTIARAFRRHPQVVNLLEQPGPVEQSAVWGEPTSHGLVRVRWDKVATVEADLIIVLDLKTSSELPTPDAFGRTVVRYGYHRQAALYLDAARAAFGAEEAHYVLAVACSREPHEVACYELPTEAIDLGRRQYQRLLRELVRRQQQNDWRAPFQVGIQTLALPGYAWIDEHNAEQQEESHA